MTAALFLADAADVAVAQVGDLVELTGPEGRHAVAVKRVTVGEQIDLADGAGTVLHARVESVAGRDSLRALVLERIASPAPEPRIVVVQALPKGERGETAVETLTEVGVDEIVPWQAERCIARWSGDKALRGRAKWSAAARAAGKQARRAWFPQVAAIASTAEVEGRTTSAGLAVVLHEDATARLRDLTIPPTGEVVLIVGPEGGVSPAELERLAAAGAIPARLGPSVLRTSTAGTVAAAVVLASTDRWS
jgi:16S rRNA (uracil1498-N3)-methyltransferase